MQIARVSCFLGVMGISACQPNSVIQDPIQQARKKTGIEIDHMDLSVSPRHNFYRYANGTWLDHTEIPQDKASFGSFTELRDRVELSLKTIVTELEQQKEMPLGSTGQRIRDLYLSYLDEVTRDRLGLQPLEADFHAIDLIRTREQFFVQMGKGIRNGWTGFLQVGVEADKKNPERHALYLSQDGLGLPDRDYYLSKEAKFLAIQSSYRDTIQKLFALARLPISTRDVEAIYSLEMELARIQWSRVENRDEEKSYNPHTPTQLQKVTGGIPWKILYREVGCDPHQVVVVEQPTYLKKLGHLLTKTPLPTLRLYEKWKRLQDTAPLLHQEMAQAHFAFYRTTLQGVKEMEPVWKRAIRVIEHSIGEDLGQLYVKRHFDSASKAQVEAMVQNLLATLGDSIPELSWMGDKTKEQAQRKLSQFHYKIGYPTRWKDYSSIRIETGDLVGNLHRAQQWQFEEDLHKLKKPVDREEWSMTPQTVNAYYHPIRNEIVFPAAILQPPFFDPKGEEAKNYGGIGAVMGHEITHGFDDQGRHFDGSGRLKDWWTPEDAAHFKKKGEGLVAQFNQYKPLPDVAVDGALTLGENIADLGGLKLALRTYLSAFPPLEAEKKEKIQALFLGYAQIWRGKVREEEVRRLVEVDPHSPGQFRVLGPCSNLHEFYEAFDVQIGDAMYRKPENRVEIW
jgi:putative endopeptidase